MPEPTQNGALRATHNKAHILDLPDELQIRILRHLSVPDLLKATGVCQKWKQLAFDGSLWKKIDVTPFYSSIPADQLLRIGIAAGRFLRVANLRGCIQLNGHGLRTLSDHCHNVQVLCLKDCRNLSTPSISCFLQRALDLRVLDLSGLDSVKDSTLHIIASLTQLEKLNLAWCRNITGSGVQAIASQCRKLTHLKLNGCSQMDVTAMESLGHLPFLSRLSLVSCTSLTDAALIAFLSTSTAPLTHLNLCNCARLTDASLRHHALHSKTLTHLELAGCVLLTDHGFSYLAPRLRTLEHVDLEDLQQITGTTVKALANNEPHLRRLCLSNCTQVTDDAITHLVLHGVCHSLTHLELDNCIVTDEALDTIARFLTTPSPTQSPITPPSPVSTASTLSFSSTATERQLNIEVLDCSNITEKGVRSALDRASPRLTIKSFYSWRDESENSRQASFSSTPRNRYITVGRQRRRRDNAGGAGQPQAANCIIL